MSLVLAHRRLCLGIALSLSLSAACTARAQAPIDAAAAPAPATAAAPARTPGADDPAPAHPQLAGTFEQFGGMPGMTALMDEFMAVLLDDPRMRPFFANVEHDRVKRQLAEQFCAILGGGCAYSGRDMQAAHAAFAIDKADFNALVEDLQIAMQRRGIPFRAQNRLLAILAPMHREVIDR